MTDSFVNFFFNDTATTEIYTLSLHDALPISGAARHGVRDLGRHQPAAAGDGPDAVLGVLGADGHFAVVDLPGVYAHLDRAGVLHHRGHVRRAEPVRLYHQA